jgi:hypothetical protein
VAALAVALRADTTASIGLLLSSRRWPAHTALIFEAALESSRVQRPEQLPACAARRRRAARRCGGPAAENARCSSRCCRRGCWARAGMLNPAQRGEACHSIGWIRPRVLITAEITMLWRGPAAHAARRHVAVDGRQVPAGVR